MLLVSVVVDLGCATTMVPGPSDPSTQANAAASAVVPSVELPTVRVSAEPTGPDALETYDAEALFVRGLDLLSGEAWLDAAGYFERLLREFPADERAVLAEYNRGVAYIHLGRGEDAVAAFDAYLAGLSPQASQKDVLDGRFKRGQALATARRYEEVVAVFDELAAEDLSPDDKVEALIDAGVGHYMLGREPGGDEVHRPTAEYRFLEARRILKRESAKRDVSHMQFFSAQAAFYLAELAHLDFSEFKLRWPTPQEISDRQEEARKAAEATSTKAAANRPAKRATAAATMAPSKDGAGAAGGDGASESGNADGGPTLESLLGEQLEAKCQRLLRAQYQYLRTIREGHPGWAAASGYGVGKMYEELHEEMRSLPAPDDLTSDQQAIYQQLVRKKVLILLEKAEKTYSQTADMVVRTGAAGVWADKSRESLALIRQRLLEETTAIAKDDAADAAADAGVAAENPAAIVPVADTGQAERGKS